MAITLSAVITASSLVAVNAAETYKCGTVDTSVNFNCPSTSEDGISSIILWAINFLAMGVGIAVVIGIIFGGITYAMSDGDAGKAKEGRGIIVNAVIGLFLFIFLWAAANFLVPGGLFK